MKSMLIPAFLGLALIAGAGSAQAAGCLKGAAIGGVAGHYAGHHAVLGAAAGCVIGHHEASRARQNQYDSRNQDYQHPGPDQPMQR